MPDAVVPSQILPACPSRAFARGAARCLASGRPGRAHHADPQDERKRATNEPSPMAPADRRDEFDISGACPVNLLRSFFKHQVRKLRMQKTIFSIGELLRSRLEFGRVK